MISKQNNTNWGYQDLMQYRIHEILLVSSPYDAFILEEDGKLTEQILSEYIGMNLSYAPRVWNAQSAKEATEIINKRFFDVIIIMMRISDMDPIKFSQKIKKLYPKKPLVLLAFDQSELKDITLHDQNIFDEIFIWSGNSNVFPAAIKSIEDKKNISKDVKTADVRTVLFIEDNPRYYSSILPVLYKEIISNTKKLIDKSLNNSQKILHMRARPKIILLKNYDDAIKYINKYRFNILGIISDLRYPYKKDKHHLSGLKLINYLNRIDSAIPIILQTTEKNIPKELKESSVKVIQKNSTILFKELQSFMIDELGFGDFKFRSPNGKIINKAKNISELISKIKKVKSDSIKFHASKNHISNWLATRGEFKLASNFREIRKNDFKNIDKRKEHYLDLLSDNINISTKTKIVEFSKKINDFSHNFIQIGTGSLGGKARGLAFANKLLNKKSFKSKYSKISIRVPKIIAIGTDEFDSFMESNNLWEIALNIKNNKKILDNFLKSKLPKNLIKILKDIINNIDYPLAIRSSSLLEDSQYKPLAGIYSTFMLPNSNKSKPERLDQLIEAIKRVYASTFFQNPKSLLNNSDHRLEEEKMGIIIMELAGKKHNELFYPSFSGVAQSYNYYPVSYMERNEGIVFTALGLGKTIVDGEKSLRFSPKYPKILSQYYSVKSTINNSQNKFYALDMNKGKNPLKFGESKNLKKFDLSIAESDGELSNVASTITNDNTIRDSLKYSGIRVLTFANIIKYNRFPLTNLIEDIMSLGEKALGCPVEIEFAINLNANKEDEFCLLQIKPMVIGIKNEELNIKNYQNKDISLCYSEQVLGNGEINSISHIVYIDPDNFKRENTEIIAEEIGNINNKLGERKKYLLIGPGRWGTSDPWLGIPVNWEQINYAKAIIEIGIDELDPDPSFGSHFFQNITNLRIGYFTFRKKYSKKNIDWKWLEKQKLIFGSKHVKVISLSKPLHIKIDGINGNGIVLKYKEKDIIEPMNEEDSSGI
tara:strand:+ start:6571 stop:9552 length:2982 start_codon:yes stop_codon:yes gene_type:complete